MSPKFTRDSFVQNLAKGQLVVPYLERFDGLDEEWTYTYVPKLGDDAWHPSGDCLPPVSALYAKAKGGGESKEFSPGTQRNFQVGHFWHALLQHVLCKKLEFCEPEAIERRGWHWWGDPVPPESDMTLNSAGQPRWDDSAAKYPGYYGNEELYYLRYPESQVRDERGKVVGVNQDFMLKAKSWPRIDLLNNGTRQARVHPRPYHWTTGSGDIVPLNLPSGWTGVFDIKTMASAMWKAAWKNGLLPPAFADKYEAQVNIYMEFFDQDRALILGVNKDAPHGFVEFEFERNQDMIDIIFEKWKYVSWCLDEGVDPDPEADKEFVLPFTGPIS